MPRYKVYSIDPHGRIHGERFIDAADEEDVIFTVRSMQRPDTTEIWQHDRRIARIPGQQA